MSSNHDRNRELGIELGDLMPSLEAATFPMTKAELIEAHGSHELGFPDDETETIEAILEPVGVEEFRSPDEVLQTLFHMVDRGAVGQPGQTGRGTSSRTPPGTQRPPGKPDEDDEVDPSF